MHRRRRFSAFVMVMLIALAAGGRALASHTAFTYQGELKQGGVLANGLFNMSFSLWDGVAGGSQVGSAVDLNNVPVGAGRFTVQLDFGAAVFDNTDRWLEVSVNGTILSPRQPITRAPYAIQTRGIFVDDDHNVGIGTTSPIFPLHVEMDEFAPAKANIAIYALNLLPSGASFGVWGQSDSTSGRGVYGTATAPSGTTYAVRGHTDSPQGFGAYFSGASGSRNYFQRNVGIGEVDPAANLHINGSGGVATGGLLVVEHGPSGRKLVFDGDELQARDGAASSELYLNAEGGSISMCQNGTSVVRIGVQTPTPISTMLHVQNHGRDSAIYADGDFLIGVNGVTTSDIGVLGEATSGTGVRGEATTGSGVVGVATSTASQNNYGVFGGNSSSTGTAIAGFAFSNTGTNIAVRGLTNSAAGYSGYFTGGRNYMQGFLGLNKLDPEVRLDVVGSIQYTGTITDVSDIRVKENIQPLADALAKVERINGVYFNMIDTPGEREVGVIAQAVQEVLPEAVRIVNSKTGHLGVSYSSLVPLLIEAVKALRGEKDAEIREQRERIEAQEHVIARQQAMIDELLRRVEGLEAQSAE